MQILSSSLQPRLGACLNQPRSGDLLVSAHRTLLQAQPPLPQGFRYPALRKAFATEPRVVCRASVEAEAPSALSMAKRFLHFEETNDYAALQQVVTPEIKWRSVPACVLGQLQPNPRVGYVRACAHENMLAVRM